MPAEELRTSGQLSSESGVLKLWGWVTPNWSRSILGKGQVHPEKLSQGFKNESFCNDNSHPKKEIWGVSSFIWTGVNM